MKDHELQIQETLQIPNMRSIRKTTLKEIVKRLQEAQNKRKMLKASRGEVKDIFPSKKNQMTNS